MPQITEQAKQHLEKQQYRIIGNHSAVKVCGWTKNMIKGEGGCYKLKFYGIMSHQCMQSTTSISCANRCIFCWRGYKAPVSKEWKWEVDDPKMIIEESIKEHIKLLNGFGGNPKTNKKLYEQSNNVKHVALSLTGEPITYPKINEIIKEYHKKKISTFLVTNGQYPEKIKNLNIVTQLYISIDAPTKELLKYIDKPLFSDYWERMIQSLKEMKKKKYRTTVRITAIKDMNMKDTEKYAELIKIVDPDFIEIKAYMFIGASRQRLSIKNMPRHEEVKKFSQQILEYLPEYEYVSEHKPSRVVLLAKKKYKKQTWINFEKFFKLVEEKKPEEYKNINVMDYLKIVDKKAFVDEKTEELKLQEDL